MKMNSTTTSSSTTTDTNTNSLTTKKSYVIPARQKSSKEWKPGTYSPIYRDRPDGNYSAILPNFLNYGHCILPPTNNRGGLYLGQQEAAQKSNLAQLQLHGIHLIVNATPRYPNYHEQDGISYLRVDVNDEPSANLLLWFDSVAERIEVELSKDRSVYVHCQMGISRSSSLILAYLIKYHNITREEAYKFTKEKRPKIEPNVGFYQQLKTYEETIQKQKEEKSTSSSSSTTTTITAHVESTVLQFLSNPKSKQLLEQSVIAVTCLSSDFSEYSNSIIINEMGSIDEILLESLNYIYDKTTDDRIKWFSFLFEILKNNKKLEKKDVVKKLDEGDDFFENYWAGEYDKEKVQKILSSLD